ncbi:hypothetical protein APHAL10511_008378 [Amanita phalloides]|nr:hypothetical protein APHAL10511_008378 [Amanita phalloides]
MKSNSRYLVAYNFLSTLSWSFLLLRTLHHFLSASPKFTTTYIAVGPIVAYVQTTAVLEVVHVLLGLVRSPIPTTAMQVSSRLFLVWAITEQFKASQDHALYGTMILAWSITEVIRYTFYTFSLLGSEPPRLLTYLRYTTFYVLYPLGAGSEAFLILASIPKELWFGKGTMSVWVFVRMAAFILWWPGLYVMYMHMMYQRRKVLGEGKSAKYDAKVQ